MPGRGGEEGREEWEVGKGLLEGHRGRNKLRREAGTKGEEGRRAKGFAITAIPSLEPNVTFQCGQETTASISGSHSACLALG